MINLITIITPIMAKRKRTAETNPAYFEKIKLYFINISFSIYNFVNFHKLHENVNIFTNFYYLFHILVHYQK